MKFYSEKLSPRRLSLQWRLTLLISGLVITACALMYFFISRSAVTGLEGISDYVVLVTPDNSNPISINVDPKILIPDLENQKVFQIFVIRWKSLVSPTSFRLP